MRTAVPILQSVASGYNGCILAYGQTGTGKTHTILGARDGLLPESLRYLFEEIDQGEGESIIEMSCLQIYMEQLTDLFDFNNRNVQLREKNGRFYVTNSLWVRLRNYDEALQVIDKAEQRRKACSTNMNLFSSRSHAIFVIKVTNMRSLVSSSLFLVDLAGSERVKKSHAQGDRLEEAISINTSLMALSKCIYGISENKGSHIPYRESKLTKLLQETLGGNSKAAVIITISPDYSDVEETMSSLKFGQRAGKVYVAPKLCKIGNDQLTSDPYLMDSQKKFLEQENIELREKCKKLMEIVETAQKGHREEEPVDFEFTDRAPLGELSGNNNYALGAYNELDCSQEQTFDELRQENYELKEKLERVELEAFEDMRLSYENIENTLYAEIDSLKSKVKKQKKKIFLLKSQIGQNIQEKAINLDENIAFHKLMTEGKFTQSQLDCISKIVSLAQNKYPESLEISTLTQEKPRSSKRRLPPKSMDSSFKGGCNDTFQTEKLVREMDEVENKMRRDTLESKLNGILDNSDSATGDSFRARIPIQKEATPRLPFTDESNVSVSFDLNNNSSIQDIARTTAHFDSNTSVVSNETTILSDDERNDLTSKLTEVIDHLVAEIDKKCSHLNSMKSDEIETKATIFKSVLLKIKPFARHARFKEILSNAKIPKMAVIKLGMDLILERFVERLVSLKLEENKNRLLRYECKQLKTLYTNDTIKEQLILCIKKERAARLIQRTFRKASWRKKFSKPVKKASFDWKRVRAGIGKEYTQIFRKECDNTFKAILEAFN